jgi:hypothetical protein
MVPNQHTIVYAAPAHAPVWTVECSCGWAAIGPDGEDEASHQAVLRGLLGNWTDHVNEAAGNAGGGNP